MCGVKIHDIMFVFCFSELLNNFGQMIIYIKCCVIIVCQYMNPTNVIVLKNGVKIA